MNERPTPVLVLFAIALALGAAACGGADRPSGYETPWVEGDPEPEPEPEPEADGGVPSGECAEGTTQSCKIMLPAQGSVTNCVIGTQYCEEGFWSECEAPESL